MLKYIGDGSMWMIGKQPIPPRDLTDAEVKLYGGKRKLLASGLYREVKDGNIISDEKGSDR